MKILIVTNLFPPVISGGFEIECYQISEALAKRGHSMYVLTSDYELTPSLKEIVPFPVERQLKLIKPFNEPISSSLRLRKWLIGRYNYKTTLNTIKGFAPDLVFLWSQLRIGIGPARAAKNSHIHYVWRIADETLANLVPAPFSWNPRGFYRYIMDRLFYWNTAEGIDFSNAACISNITKQRLIKKGIDLSNACLIRKGIFVEDFPIKEHPGEFSDPIRILYVGRLYPQKGVHTIVEAVGIAQQKTSRKLELTLVGEGTDEYCSHLKALAEGKSFKLTFLGFVPHEKTSPIYRSHDFFIFASNSLEANGSTFLEALSSGLPVISTNKGGHGEVLHDEFNALIFPEENAEVLSQQILRLIEDPELCKKLVMNGRKNIEEQFSFKTYIDSLEQFLLEQQNSYDQF